MGLKVVSEALELLHFKIPDIAVTDCDNVDLLEKLLVVSVVSTLACSHFCCAYYVHPQNGRVLKQ